ncbi:MAG: signal peptidase I [Allosphingosinicella sp.]
MESETPPGAAAAGAEGVGPDDTTAAPKRKESWWETLRFFLLLFLAAVALRSLLFAPFSIPSGSMLPNLMIGDYLFVSKFPYGFSRHSFPFGIASFDGRIFERLPERGDIVVFRYPGLEDADYVKRVIGLPGDQIEVRGGTVILNGTPVQRQRIADFAVPVSPNSPCRPDGSTRETVQPDGARACAYPRYRETLPGGRSYDVLDQVADGAGDNMPAVIVPDGQLFVMGDNRDDSLDSRFEVAEGGVGLLPVDNVLGPAAIAFWSTDGSAEWIKPWTWFSAARWDRLGRTW